MNEAKMQPQEHSHPQKQYMHLSLMILASFIAMYFLMYSMIDSGADFFHSINQVYMAGQMAAAMVIIELIFMRAMYKNKRLNTAIITLSGLALVLFYMGTRKQFAVTDTQFLRSMIPHHSGAILMCNEAPIENGKIKDLCKQIITSQRSEIEQMKGLLKETKEPSSDNSGRMSSNERF